MLTEIEFQEIVTEYILPLLPPVVLKSKTAEKSDGKKHNFIEETVGSPKSKKERTLSFFSSRGKNAYTLSGKIYFGKQFWKTAASALEEIVKIGNIFSKAKLESKNNFLRLKKDFLGSYLDFCCQEAVLSSVCNELTGNNTEKLIEIICSLEKWSQKTYEGRKVPFGFIINCDKKGPKSAEDYVSFLKSEHSAAFSDGVFSAVLLDQDGRVLRHEALTYSNVHENIDTLHAALAPTRFRNFTDLCDGSNIGILALSNGDILLIKNKQLEFAKRNGVWSAYGWGAFVQPCIFGALGSNDKLDSEVKERLARVIFQTWLDVSFSHSGGCLAVVNSNHSDNNPALEDALKNCLLSKPLAKEFQRKVGKEKATALNQKNHIIKCLVSYNNRTKKTTPFFSLSDKLRAELLSLDGATVITDEGNILATGAILLISSGSEGGGRLAAARELSKYGFSAKISEDGGISVFLDERLILHLG